MKYWRGSFDMDDSHRRRGHSVTWIRYDDQRQCQVEQTILWQHVGKINRNSSNEWQNWRKARTNW
jgi:hypothetical protein